MGLGPKENEALILLTDLLADLLAFFFFTLQQLGLGPKENEALIPVIADLLAFSPADLERIASAQVCLSSY